MIRFTAYVVSLFLTLAAAGASAQDALEDESVATPPQAHLGASQESIYPLQSPDLGIEITSVYLSAAGYMVDVRYKVIDVERARRFITRQIKPVLIDEATGNQFRVPIPPKIGELRHTGAKLDPERTYFMMFVNPSRMIRPGQRLAIVFGDARIDGLIVQ